MDERKKIQVKNTATHVAKGTFLPVCAAVFTALAPVVGTVNVVKYIKEKKEKDIHVSNKEDVLRALQIYSQALMQPTRSVIAEMKNDAEKGKKELKQYDDKMVAAAQELERKIAAEERKQRQQAAEQEANTPEALAKSGVQDLLDIIKTAPGLGYCPVPKDLVVPTIKYFVFTEDMVGEDHIEEVGQHYYVVIGGGRHAISVYKSAVFLGREEVLDIPELQQATVEKCYQQRLQQNRLKYEEERNLNLSEKEKDLWEYRKQLAEERELKRLQEEVQGPMKQALLRANVSEK